jgi:hypothetical protein
MEGIQSPRQDWAVATAAGEDNWKAGVQAAATAGRFSKGVRKAGSSVWAAGALGKGKDRYAPGVADAKEKYAAGVQPYLDAIGSITLPPRYPRGDSRNIARVTAITTALHNKKMSSVS